MKTFLTTTVLLCLAITASIVYANWKKAPAVTTAPGETGSVPASLPPETTPAKPQLAATSRLNKKPGELRTSPIAVADNTGTDTRSVFDRTIDTLVSPAATYQERQALWKSLREANQLDQAIDALKQGVTNNPGSPEYPAALGWALLQKAGEVSKKGGSVNELGILGMSADQNFDNALKIDPANWDAQFFKAVSMSYWPAGLNKSDEVVQRLSSLIDQQETMPAQPHFANTYVVLGEQYLKQGQTENAQQTWQAGAAKFPGDAVLQKKISGK